MRFLLGLFLAFVGSALAGDIQFSPIGPYRRYMNPDQIEGSTATTAVLFLGMQSALMSTVSGGILKTENWDRSQPTSSATWRRVFPVAISSAQANNYKGALSCSSISHMSQSPLDKNFIVATCGEVSAFAQITAELGGVVVSRDGGNTWTYGSGLPIGKDFRASTVVSIKDGSIAKHTIVAVSDGAARYPEYASGGLNNFVGGIYVSTDDGATWTMTQSGSFHDIAQHPTLRGTLIATSLQWSAQTAADSVDILWISRDSGATWSKYSELVPFSSSACASMDTTTSGNFIRTRITTYPGQPSWNVSLAVDPLTSSAALNFSSTFFAVIAMSVDTGSQYCYGLALLHDLSGTPLSSLSLPLSNEDPDQIGGFGIQPDVHFAAELHPSVSGILFIGGQGTQRWTGNITNITSPDVEWTQTILEDFSLPFTPHADHRCSAVCPFTGVMIDCSDGALALVPQPLQLVTNQTYYHLAQYHSIPGQEAVFLSLDVATKSLMAGTQDNVRFFVAALPQKNNKL